MWQKSVLEGIRILYVSLYVNNFEGCSSSYAGMEDAREKSKYLSRKIKPRKGKSQQVKRLWSFVAWRWASE